MSHNSTPHLHKDGQNRVIDSTSSVSDSQAGNARQLLNAYVYDFLIKSRLPQTARIFVNEAEVPLQDSTSAKNSPQLNAPSPSLQQFARDNNLPTTKVAMDAPQGFLFEWWQVFWDVFQAKNNKSTSPLAIQYHQLQLMKQRQQQEMQGFQNAGPNGFQLAGGPMQNVDQQQQQRMMMQLMMKHPPDQMGGMPVQQQMFMGQNPPGQNVPPNVAGQTAVPGNRIQQHAQSQMKNLRQAAVAAHHDAGSPNGNPGGRMGQMTPQAQHAQPPPMGGMPYQQPMNGSQAPTPFPQGQPGSSVMRMNSVSNGAKPDMNNGRPPVPANRNINALQDYQMQLMLLEKQNKKRLDIARNSGSADPNSLANLTSNMLPPQQQMPPAQPPVMGGGMPQQMPQQIVQPSHPNKVSPANTGPSPIIGNKPSPGTKKKKDPPKRGRKPSAASHNNTNTITTPSSAPTPSHLKKEFSTPLTPTSETPNDTTKRKRKNTNDSPKKANNSKVAKKDPESIKEEKEGRKEDDSLSMMAPPSAMSTSFPDHMRQNDQMFPEILENNPNNDNQFFDTGPMGNGLDDIDFDFNQFLDGNVNDGMNTFNWEGVDAIDGGES